MTTHRSKPIAVAMSHDRPRTELGPTPPLPPSTAEDAAPQNDPVTGRIVNGRLAARRRWLKRRSKGIATLNPAAVPTWMRSSVEEGAKVGHQLAERFDDPVLAPLIGDTADAHAVFRALLALGASGEGDTKALGEARAWLREYRACMRELSALAAVAKTAEDDAALTVDPLALPAGEVDPLTTHDDEDEPE